MQRSIHAFPMILIALILFLCGCHDDPANPSLDAGGATDVGDLQASAPSHHCLGYFSLVFDTVEGSVTALPVRSADWHFNMTGVLNATMGVSAAGVPSEHDPPNGLFVFDITLTHPFATKPQFAGFDVKGILMTPGTLAVGPLIFADADETQLENADGYARWWNPTEFTAPGILGYTKGAFAAATAAQLTATVNPYKLFADRLGPEDSLSWVSGEPLDSPEGRAVFTAGSSNTRRYRIRFEMDPGPKIIYGYAIDCAWNAPSPNPPGEVPDDFPMNANQPEAYRIVLQPTANSLYFDGESGVGGGVLRFQINVHDWQGQATGDIAAQVSSVRLYAPGMMASGVDAVFVNQDSLKARYSADLTGLAVPTGAGETQVICRVESSDGSSYRQTPTPAPNETVSAFQVLTLDIPDPECVGDTNNDFSEALSLDLENPTVDQMCAPDDYRDFFIMDLPVGNDISGDVTLYCDPEPTKFALYDESQALMSEVSVSAGSASLDLGALGVMPGTYYLRVFTQTSGEAFLYAIVPSFQFTDLTPHAVDVTPDGLYFDPHLVQGYDQLAIASNIRQLWIYDYTIDEFNPELLSRTNITAWVKPGLAYPYLYTSDGNDPSSIGMVDITDPSAPVVHEDIVSAGGFVLTILAEPDYLYLCTSPGPVDIYDIATNPAAPELVGTVPGATGAQEVAIIHDATGPQCWLALSTHSTDFVIYDITDKANITFWGGSWWGPSAIVWDLASIDNYLFCIIEEPPIFSMWAYCIDSGGLSYQDNVTFSIEPQLLDVGDGWAFTAGGTHVAKIDISDPGNLPAPDEYTFPEANILDMDVEGDHVFHALGSAGLRCVGTGGVDFGRTYGLATGNQMVVDGDSLFAIESDWIYSAIKSVDISDPGAAFVAGEVLLDKSPILIAAKNGKMVAFTSDDRLKTIDCADASNMIVQNDQASPQYVTAMGMTDTALFLGYFDTSIEVMNLSSWPVLSSWTTIPAGTYSARTFLFKSNVMYVEAGGNILVYAISDPGSPSLADTYFPQQAARQITIHGDFLYIATADYLEIADISDPMDPVFVATEPHPDAPNGEYVAAVDQFAIVQPYWTTPPTVMRVWPPDDPTVIGALYGPEYAVKPNQVLVYNGYYYERHSDFGLRIWDLY